MSWEDTLRSWAKAPGQTEEAKCDNAVRAIRKAIDASPVLNKRSIRVFAQGSYCNRTNVRADSDVDVCVLCSDTFFYDLPNDQATASDFDITPASYHYSQFKNELQSALTSYFGKDGVTRGNKAFDIHPNSYRVDADAVPCFEYRRYDTDDGTHLTGTAFDPDNGVRVVNWPEQNYENGVAKNKATGGRFKDVVRILKRLRNHMADEEEIPEASPIPSFLIECLVWNVPNTDFGHYTYRLDVREALASLFNNTLSYEKCSEWGEVNELKYLFRGPKAWTWQQAHAFTSAAWNYLELE